MIWEPPLHGGQLRQISERLGIPIKQLIDFSVNVNPEGPPPLVLSTLRASLDDPEVVSSYPDLEQLELKQAISRFANIPADTITVSNGFVPLLESALRLLKIRHCLLPVPAFLEYRRTLERVSINVIPYPLSEELGFRYDVEAMVASGHDAILLANPQNPSGVLTSKQTLLTLAELAAAQGITVLLDEAFIDYAPSQSLARDAGRLSNLIVFRSVTKFFGVPGLRVAYVVANEVMTRALSDVTAPWPISTLAARAVAAGLADEEFAERTRLMNERRRDDLKAKLEELGFVTYTSAANFLLIRPAASVYGSLLWQHAITEYSLVLRDCSNYEGLSSGYLRVAIRTKRDNDLLVEVIRKLHHYPSKQPILYRE